MSNPTPEQTDITTDAVPTVPPTPQNIFTKDTQRESLTRNDRLKTLTTQVDQLFPGEKLAALRANITRSFSVPQFGPYHNEGMFMDKHLELILANIQDVKQGKFPDSVPQEARAMMQEVASGNERTLKMYALLHDISKADSLTIKYANGVAVEPTWDEWTATLTPEARNDPREFEDFCHVQGITGVSYFQKEKGNKHGEMGAQHLADLREDMGVPQTVLTAIKNHEVAYQFQKVSIKTYEKYFGDLNEEETKWVITASYIDTMGSIGEQGSPNLSNFIAMVDTVYNYKTIKQAKTAIETSPDTDPKKVEKAIDALRKQEVRITEDANTLIDRLKQECKFSTYDSTKLGASLDALVATNQIDGNTKDGILACLDHQTGRLNETALTAIRGKLGKVNQMIKEALIDAERK